MKSSLRARTLIAGLGPAQLLAWGTLYYAIAVLAEPMRSELQLGSSHVFGAFAWSMIISGLLAPWAGRTLDRISGRKVLMASAAVALTIAKATLPVEMFGLRNIGAVLGGFSAPSLVTRALAPFGFAVALGGIGAEGAIAGLIAVSFAACAAYVATTRVALLAHGTIKAVARF